MIAAVLIGCIRFIDGSINWSLSEATVEIITGEARRRWSREEKLAAVVATFQPETTVASVARRMRQHRDGVYLTQAVSRRAGISCTCSGDWFCAGDAYGARAAAC